MKQVNIYYNLHDKNTKLYEIAKENYLKNQQVLILLDDDKHMDKINVTLWSKEKLFFLPHCVIQHELAEQTPIVLSVNYPNEDHPIAKQNRIVINLKHSIKDCINYINSEITELINTDFEERDLGRERVKFYKESGWNVKFFG